MGKGTTDQTTSTSRALAAEGHARLRNGPLGNLIEWAQHRTSAAGSRVYCGTMRHDCKSCPSQAAIGPKGKKCRTRMSDPHRIVQTTASDVQADVRSLSCAPSSRRVGMTRLKRLLFSSTQVGCNRGGGLCNIMNVFDTHLNARCLCPRIRAVEN